mgnify:FL=1
MSDQIPDNPIELWQEYHSGIPDSTMNNKLSALGRFNEWLNDNSTADNVLNVKLIDVQNWLVHLYQTEELAGSTVNQYHNELRGFYNAWINEGGNRSLLAEQEYELSENPASFNLSEYLNFSKTTKKQNYADNNQGIIHVKPSEVRKLRASVESVRDELLIKLLHQTGLRRSEVSALKLPQHKSDSHIDTEKKQIVISEADSKTDNGGRTVPYQDLEPELTMWLNKGFRNRHCYADDSPYLFLTKQTSSISPNTISRIIREAADDAGIQEIYGTDADGNPKRRITAHSLRSAFVIQLFDAGLPSPKVMELSGHNQLETVESYANVLDDNAISAYREADIDFEA